MNCSICDKAITKSSYLLSEPICSSECFKDYYWNEKLKIKDDPNSVRIDNMQYYIGDSNKSSSQFKGYGGQTFTIKFHDGRIITTNNLWHNGEIPKKYRELLPDNAVFIKPNGQDGKDKI